MNNCNHGEESEVLLESRLNKNEHNKKSQKTKTVLYMSPDGRNVTIASQKLRKKSKKEREFTCVI